MTVSIHIVTLGARTPVGLGVAASAAAVRAGITALKHHPFMVDQVGDLMPGALDAEIDPHVMGSDRMLLIAEPALREACAPLSEGPGLRSRLPLYLGLPEVRPGFSDRDAEALRTRAARIAGLPVELGEIKLFTEGHAAGFSALSAALVMIRQGAHEACLIGGVDSYFQPDTMEWLDSNRQLVGAVSRSGFVPGEAAGFCMLMTERALARSGLKTLARVLDAALGKETKLIKSTAICLGEGLTAAVRDVLQALRRPHERISSIFCDINGERYRSEEWGFVCLRLGQHFDDATAYVSPAESWGDVGAASGPLLAALACRAFVRGYATGPRILLWASSENGQRGAAVLCDSSSATKAAN